MAAADGESSSMAQKKNKGGHKRKQEEELECMDSLPWSSSISIGEDDDEKTFSTLFAGTAQLDGEIDEADYNLATFPTTESGKTEKGLNSKRQARKNSDGNKEAVDEIIDEGEGGEEDGDEMKGEDDLDSPKIKEKKNC